MRVNHFMITVLADGGLPHLEALLGTSFQITRYHNTQELYNKISDQDVLLCRSTLSVNSALLAGSSIRCVATASSGTDHIDDCYLQKQHITLLDAKGSNARSVADYVTSCLAYLQSSLGWQGVQAGVIGVGAVGSLVNIRLQRLGYSVKVYDPIRALSDSNFTQDDLIDVLQSDVICVHAHLHDGPLYPSRHLLNATLLAKMKPHAVLINAARGDIIDEKALLNCSQPLLYCTDVYTHEPRISREIVEYATLCTPHIAGHSIEARNRMVVDACYKIKQWAGQENVTKPVSETISNRVITEQDSWQDTLLSLYNPILETRALKQAKDLQQAFLTVRQSHRHRHDFCSYKVQSDNALLQTLLSE